VLDRHQLRNVQRRYITDPEARVAQGPSEDERLESVLRAHSFAGMALAIGHEFPRSVDIKHIKQILAGEGLLRLYLCISNDFMFLRGPVIRQPFAALAVGEEAAQVRREARSSGIAQLVSPDSPVLAPAFYFCVDSDSAKTAETLARWGHYPSPGCTRCDVFGEAKEPQREQVFERHQTIFRRLRSRGCSY
jgi:hypothetical protein